MDSRVPAAALHLAAIVESSDDAIISKDLDGIITSWNRGAERMFGYSAEEVIGTSITIIIPADRLNEEAYVVSRIRAGKQVDHFETLRRRKDGSLIPVSLTTSPIRDVDGRVIGASKNARDITDRRRAEAALADADARRADLQQRLKALLAASGSLFSSPRLEDVIPSIVELSLALLRADACALWRIDATSASWTIVGSTGLSDAFERRIAELYAGKAPASTLLSEPLVAEVVREVPWLEDQAHAYQAEAIESMLAVPFVVAGRTNGAVTLYYRMRHAFSDVELDTARSLSQLAGAAIATAELYDEQRRQREAAERANDQAAFLAEASAVLASSLDYEKNLRAVAHLAVPRIADFCAIETAGNADPLTRVTIAHVDPVRANAARALVDRYREPTRASPALPRLLGARVPALVPRITDEMLRGIAADSEPLQALRDLALRSVLAVPLAAHDRVFGVIAFASAESDRHFDDADLRFAQDVAYRIALAIENARAREQANIANRAKDEFLATLSHEMRTPLNAVLGWVRMLRAGTLGSEKTVRAFEVIERNAIAQLRLVEDLLDLSRIITGKLRLDVAALNLADVVAATVEAVTPAATAKAIEIKVEMTPAAPVVVGDRARLQQVVWNLLLNAIKFTPRRGRIDVRVRQRDDAQIDIEVQDTGEGISAEVLPYVFDRFRQGESGTTRTHSGLGLGLAIVRHIVELHGGRVEVTSPGKGRGATFRFTLPAHVETRPAVSTAATVTQAAPSEVRTPLTGLHALVVDDDRDARELVAEVLRSHGMRVTMVGSAAEGLAALDRSVPDVIVSDLAMPELDGFELIRRVRERQAERGGAVPAVALTAYARPEDTARSLTSGFQVHLAKPVDMEDLVSTVATLAKR